ncbi:hypothetical protein GCM10009117_18400 [Gangjinia marincola]|uniref:Alanine racemase n=1 Tax=Gangjinia marincola TaxID=578463 RepID=A0ABN1MHM4_9FLAO
MHVTVLTIDLRALEHNFHYLKSKLKSNGKIMAVVKAFGYGSDALEIAKKLQELAIDYFAVAYVDEGISLRKAGIETPILVLHPQPQNFSACIEHCLEPGLYSKRVFKAFLKIADEQQLEHYPVHVKFNSGLNRLGFNEKDISWLANHLNQSNSIIAKSLFSHLAASEDEKERDFTLGQINAFKKLSTSLSKKLSHLPWLHQSNTSAILNFPEAHFDIVRTGIGLYGYGNAAKYDEELRPIASLTSVISQIHEIAAGESVGYNRAFIAEQNVRSATIPIGHADGITRIYGNKKASVTINGQKAPILGNVCMDMLMVDVTAIDCNEGDEVVIFDQKNKASSFAESAGTISYELLTDIGHRVTRVFKR